MCRLQDSFFGLLSIRTGTLFIGIGMFIFSVVALGMQVSDPLFQKAIFIGGVGIEPIILFAWTCADLIAYLCLILGVILVKPGLLILWLVIIIIGMCGTVFDVVQTVTSAKSADTVYARIANACIIMEAWVYMTIVAYNCYLDMHGVSRGSSLINLGGSIERFHEVHHLDVDFPLTAMDATRKAFTHRLAAALQTESQSRRSYQHPNVDILTATNFIDLK